MSKAKENRMSREDAQAALKRGEHLAVGATVYRRGDRLPAPPPGPEGEEPDASLEAVVVRDADGHLTRAGMEHALKSGGSVMIGGEVITDAERLPSEEEWAAHREARQQAAADALDAQIASLQAQKKARGKPGEATAAAWSPAPAPSGGKGTDASAATPEDYSVAGGVPTVGRTEETAPKHGRAQHKRSE
jgi:hypothetical protein